MYAQTHTASERVNESSVLYFDGINKYYPGTLRGSFEMSNDQKQVCQNTRVAESVVGNI